MNDPTPIRPLPPQPERVPLFPPGPTIALMIAGVLGVVSLLAFSCGLAVFAFRCGAGAL